MRKIIDCHTHAFPDKIATKAIISLSKEDSPYVSHTDGTADDLVRVLNQNNVEKALVANIATKPSQVDNILNWSKMLIQQYNGRLIPLASFYPKCDTWQADLTRCLQSNLIGFKFHPVYQNFNLDDPIMFPIYEQISNSGKFILFHNGYDVAYSKEYDNASPIRMAKVLDKFPKLKVIASHVGGWQDWENVYKILVGRDVYFDISFINELPLELVYKILNKHDENRFVFGSDSPWLVQKELIDFVENLEISENKKDKLFYGNAINLLNCAK